MALSPLEAAEAAAIKAETAFLNGFIREMSVRLTRTPAPLDKTNFETGEPGSATTFIADKGLDTEREVLMEKITYTSKGLEQPANDNLPELWAPLLSIISEKDKDGNTTGIDQGMMMALTESIMAATTQAIAAGIREHVAYFLSNFQIVLPVAPLATGLNFIAPAIPAAPAPLIPVAPTVNIPRARDVNKIDITGGYA
jgi:hypothetical protein